MRRPIIEISSEIALDIIQDFKNTMEEKNLNNTFSSENSLRAVVDNNSIEIRGAKHFEQLNTGRPPGKFPPVDRMRSYVVTRLGIGDLKQVRSIAFLVGRKISREGTEIFKNPSLGIELSKRQKYGTKLIKERITAAIRLNTKSDINVELNKILILK